jgi:integrase
MRDALLIQILFYCGLRLSEARALRFDCFDAEACTVQVKARCDRQGSLGRLKTGRAFRHVPVTAELIQEVVQFEAHNNSPFLFTTRNRTILDDASIRKNIWIPAHRESGVVLRNIHAARHFFASRHIEIGTNLKELSALLGHADEAFTLRVYGHLFDDKENRARRRRQAESLVV